VYDTVEILILDKRDPSNNSSKNMKNSNSDKEHSYLRLYCIENKGKKVPKLWNNKLNKIKEMIWLYNNKSFKYLRVDVCLNLNRKDNIKRIEGKI
jgi:aryl-phospho-beta-D-glucosidase BglC (GH1 family)